MRFETALFFALIHADNLHLRKRWTGGFCALI